MVGRVFNTLIMFLVLSFIPILLFSQASDERLNMAFRLYNEGLAAYQSGEFERALKLFEEALVILPEMESYAPEIKLYIGVSAYYIGDYAKARTYLQLFPESPLARELLETMKNKKVEELPSFREKVETTHAGTTSTEGTKRETNFLTILFLLTPLIGVGGFFLVFLILLKLRGPVIAEALVPARQTSQMETAEAQETAIEQGPILSNEGGIIEEIDVGEILKTDLEDVRELLSDVESMETQEKVEEVEEKTAEAKEVAEEMLEEKETAGVDITESKTEGAEEQEWQEQGEKMLYLFQEALDILDDKLNEISEKPETGEEVGPEDLEKLKMSFDEIVENLEKSEEIDDEDLHILLVKARDHVLGIDVEEEEGETEN
ncbi:MAG: tetratricopeptide repeat protein [Thermotogae bacterium]|nr:tetratricopeptide repeat protein [Thermotogota bacterium]